MTVQKKKPKILDIPIIAVIILEFEQCDFTTQQYTVCPKDVDGMANSLYPAQTAPAGAV